MEITEKTHDTTVLISSLCLPLNEQCSNIKFVIYSIENQVRNYRDIKLQLIVTPFMPFLRFTEGRETEDLKGFCDLAKKHSVTLIIGLKEIANSGKIFHTSLIINPEGQIAGRYRKSHRVAEDDTDFALGDELPVFDVSGIKVGLTLTSDFYFMEVYSVLRLKGADIFVWQHYPEKLREHSSWPYLLYNRARDHNRFLITAMYADEAAYLTNCHNISVQGSPFGRSMIIDPSGTVRADTAYNSGVAQLPIELDKKKKELFKGQTNSLFTVPNNGGRKAFAPIAQSWQKPALPKFKKRTARIVVTARMTGKNWQDDIYPESIFNILKKAESLKPDLILFSEENTKVSNAVTGKAMIQIGQWAKRNKCYVVIGGLRDDTRWSIARVWNRNGEIFFTEPIYWAKGIEEIKVFDTDFARVGIRTCGDISIPEIDRVLALKGAELILDPSMMWGPNGYHNEISARSRAIDNASYVACSHFHSSDFSLRSFICDPYGITITAAQYGNEELAWTDIDFSKQKIYYAGTEKNTSPEKIYEHYTGQVPEQKQGWRDMIFNNRRPELYAIITSDEHKDLCK